MRSKTSGNSIFKRLTNSKNGRKKKKKKPPASDSSTGVSKIDESYVRKVRKVFLNSIAKKVAFSFLITIFILGFLIVFIMSKSVQYNNEYNILVDNIFTIMN